MFTVEVKFFDRHYVVFPTHSLETIAEDLKKVSGKTMDDVREMVIRA